jgi:stage V sporulation protein G
MKITDVRIFPVDDKKLRAFVSIIFDGCFLVSDIKIIDGNQGLFLSMPSKKRRDGTFKDVAHPLNSETRKMMEDTIFEKYREEEASGRIVRSPEPAAEVAEPSAEVSEPPAEVSEPIVESPADAPPED